MLLFSHLLRSDFRQFVRACFTDQDGNFIVRWLAATFRCESLDRCVPLRAPYAVSFEQLGGDTTDLEATILALGITVRPDFIAKSAHLTRQGVAVDLS